MPHSRDGELLPHGEALVAADQRTMGWLGVVMMEGTGRVLGGKAALRGRSAQSLSTSGSSKHKATAERPQAPGLGLRHQHTHPQKGGKSLAVVSNGKVVWLGPEDFHDVFIEFCLLNLKGENS